MDNIHGYIRARKFHEYEYEYAKFSWIISMESPNLCPVTKQSTGFVIGNTQILYHVDKTHGCSQIVEPARGSK